MSLRGFTGRVGGQDIAFVPEVVGSARGIAAGLLPCRFLGHKSCGTQKCRRSGEYRVSGDLEWARGYLEWAFEASARHRARPLHFSYYLTQALLPAGRMAVLLQFYFEESLISRTGLSGISGRDLRINGSKYPLDQKNF